MSIFEDFDAEILNREYPDNVEKFLNRTPLSHIWGSPQHYLYFTTVKLPSDISIVNALDLVEEAVRAPVIESSQNSDSLKFVETLSDENISMIKEAYLSYITAFDTLIYELQWDVDKPFSQFMYALDADLGVMKALRHRMNSPVVLPFPDFEKSDLDIICSLLERIKNLFNRIKFISD